MSGDRLPPGQVLTPRFPVLHHGQVQRLDFGRWVLRLFGEVKREVRLDREAFTRLPWTTVTCDIHCVTGWSKLDTRWEGVLASDLMQVVDLRPGAESVLVHAPGGWTTNLTLDDFTAPDVLLARRYDGRPLAPEHGAPVRLVVPHLYFWKSAKWVTGIEFTSDQRPGFWESRGYHLRGDPWAEERYRDDPAWGD